jgi:hypothetical protein
MVEVGTADYQSTHCNIVFRLTNTLTIKKEVALVKTGIAFLDNKTRKISAVPDVFRKKCESLKT